MPEEREPDAFEPTRMTVGQHIDELRRRLVKALLGLALGFVVCLCVGNRIVKFIKQPVEAALKAYDQGEIAPEMKADAQAPAGEPVRIFLKRDATDADLDAAPERYKTLGEAVRVDRQNRTVYLEGELAPATAPTAETREPGRVTTLGPAEAFSIYIKVSLIAGLILSCPYVFYQIWAFVSAGLYSKEKRFSYTLLPLAVVLFVGGAFFCYFVVFPQVLRFLLWFNFWLDMRPQIRMSDWLGFALFLPLTFGLAFQLPLAMYLLERIGLVQRRTFTKKRRYAILICFVAAMLLTPPDPMSQLLMALPLVALYEMGIWLIWLRREPDDDEDHLDEDYPTTG